MVAIKSHQADKIIADPPKGTHAFLIYGTDEGRISENAVLLARSWSKKFGDGGEVVQIDDRTIADNPDIIAIEVRSVSMFGGFSVIRLKLGNRIKPDLISELIELKPQNLIILEAGNLKPSSAMRKLFEKSKLASAIPCYPDEARDIAGLIDAELIDKGISISKDARNMLSASLGSDRGISRQELIKLALYAHERQVIEQEDIEAIIGDSSQLAYDQLITSDISWTRVSCSIETGSFTGLWIDQCGSYDLAWPTSHPALQASDLDRKRSSSWRCRQLNAPPCPFQATRCNGSAGYEVQTAYS